jgi:Predicted esterase of the alpha-beta hydrolase superfamily
MKRLVFVLAMVGLVGCQGLKTRESMQRPTSAPSRPGVFTPTPSQPTPPPPPQEHHDDEQDYSDVEAAPAPPPPPSIPAMPKVGIILGAGGARAYGHVGFLREMAKLKIPVTAIGGVEFAAPMAALYANKELANDVEWQMFKMKDEEIFKKSLLGSSNRNIEVTALKEFMQTSFNRLNAQDFRVPFACPAYNFAKNQAYLMNRGSMDQVLYTCMAYPPFFKPYNSVVAGVRDVTALANYLRQRGANYVVLVNVLPSPGKKSLVGDNASTDYVLWSEIQGAYNKPFPGVDTVVSLDVGDYGIMEFNKRREIMNKGADSAAKQLKVLARKVGL